MRGRILTRSHVPLPTTLGSRRGWYDVGALSFADGVAVDSFADGFGNGNTLSQATGIKQPLYRASGGPKGRPALLFDGTDDSLQNASAMPATQPYSIYCVCKQNTAANKVPFSCNTNAIVYTFTATTGRINAGADVIFNCVITNWTLLGVVFNGASSVINVNGVETTGNPGTGGAARLSMGCYSTGGFEWAGLIAELVTFSAAHDVNERRTMMRYLSRKYGIAIT